MFVGDVRKPTTQFDPQQRGGRPRFRYAGVLQVDADVVLGAYTNEPCARYFGRWAQLRIRRPVTQL